MNNNTPTERNVLSLVGSLGGIFLCPKSEKLEEKIILYSLPHNASYKALQ